MINLPIDKSKLKKELNKETFGSFYKTVGGREGEKCFYPTRLDTYGKGCYFDCSYCYAKGLLDFRCLWNPNTPATPTVEELIKIIKNIPKGSVVRLGGMTDCFQPIERIKRTTYKTIKLLNKRKIHYLIVTKSDLIMRKEYLDLMDKKLAHIQVSIPTNNNKVLNLTDNAKPFENRKEVVENLYEKGFDVSLRLAPFLYTTSDFDIINNINVSKCLVEFLRVNYLVKRNLNNIIDLSPYTFKEGGYYHLPLKIKKEVLKKLNFEQLSVCDDVDIHYKYFLKNVCYNPKDCCNLDLNR